MNNSVQASASAAIAKFGGVSSPTGESTSRSAYGRYALADHYTARQQSFKPQQQPALPESRDFQTESRRQFASKPVPDYGYRASPRKQLQTEMSAANPNADKASAMGLYGRSPDKVTGLAGQVANPRA